MFCAPLDAAIYKTFNVTSNTLQECILKNLEKWETQINNCEKCQAIGMSNFDDTPIIVPCITIKSN